MEYGGPKRQKEPIKTRDAAIRGRVARSSRIRLCTMCRPRKTRYAAARHRTYGRQ